MPLPDLEVTAGEFAVLTSGPRGPGPSQTPRPPEGPLPSSASPPPLCMSTAEQQTPAQLFPCFLPIPHQRAGPSKPQPPAPSLLPLLTLQGYTPALSTAMSSTSLVPVVCCSPSQPTCPGPGTPWERGGALCALLAEPTLHPGRWGTPLNSAWTENMWPIWCSLSCGERRNEVPSPHSPHAPSARGPWFPNQLSGPGPPLRRHPFQQPVAP